MIELTAAPLRIATRQRITTPYSRNVKITYIEGTRPINDTYRTHVMDLQCELCTWVLEWDQIYMFKLKFVNRQCLVHNRLIEPRMR